MRPRSSSRLSVGCLVLFALPFAAVGLFMAGQISHSLWRSNQARHWEQVPARILSTDLVNGDDTSQVVARYEYEFGGRTFTGHQVGLSDKADNIGEWHAQTHARLRESLASGEPVTAYVDPHHPDRALLDPNIRWGMIGFYSLFVIVFGGAGFGLMIFAVRGRNKMARLEQQRLAHPDQPWLQREDWAGKVIKSTAHSTLVLSVVFALFWNAVSLPIVFAVPRELERGNQLVLLALLFPVVGLGLLVWAVRSVIRWRRFGRATLTLATLPGVIGGPLRGTVGVGAKLRPANGFRLTLNCVRRHTTGTGKNRRTSEIILWQDEQTITAAGLGRDAQGTALPVSFAIPYDADPTDDRDPDNRIVWRVVVAADIPGVDYLSTFEVPVFRTPDSAADFAGTASQTAGTTHHDPGLLTRAGVQFTTTANGCDILLPPARQPRLALGLTVFGVVWCGIVVLLARSDAPLIFPLLFGFFAVLIGWGVLDLWLSASGIAVRSARGDQPAKLAWRGGWFGRGKRYEWAAEDIKSLTAVTGMQSGNKLYFAIKLTPRSGRPRTIARRLAGRRQAEALVDKMLEVLGIQQD